MRISATGKYILPEENDVNQAKKEYYLAGGQDKYFTTKNFELYGLDFIA